MESAPCNKSQSEKEEEKNAVFYKYNIICS